MSEIPEFEIKDSEVFKIIYATGAFGGLAPNDGRIILFVERLQTGPVRGQPGQERVEKVIRERLVEIHVTPATWKSIARWMQDHVTNFEKQFGTIPEQPVGAQQRPPTGLTV